MNVEGEKELTGRGVTYCATCDARFLPGRKWPSSAGEISPSSPPGHGESGEPRGHGLSHTAYRRPDYDRKLADAKNLTIYTGYQTEKILGQGLTEGIVIKKIKTGKTEQLDIPGICRNRTGTKLGYGQKLVKLNQNSEVPVNCSGETEIPGLYAAGDVTTVPEKQIVIAAGEGAKAALRPTAIYREWRDKFDSFLINDISI